MGSLEDLTFWGWMGSLEGARWDPWKIPHPRAAAVSATDPSQVLWGWSHTPPGIWARKLPWHGELMFLLHRDETPKGSSRSGLSFPAPAAEPGDPWEDAPNRAPGMPEGFTLKLLLLDFRGVLGGNFSFPPRFSPWSCWGGGEGQPAFLPGSRPWPLFPPGTAGLENTGKPRMPEAAKPHGILLKI